jgi:predicted PurR-regulated permease PerM
MTEPTRPHDQEAWRTIPTGTFVRAAVALVIVYGLAQVAAKLTNLWILIFGSVVVAVILRSIADPLVKRLRLPSGLAVGLAVLIVLSILGAIGFLFGRQIYAQMDALSTNLPRAWAVVQARWAASPFTGVIIDQIKSLGPEAGRALALAPRVASATVSGIATLVLVLVAGVFLAVHPERSREGVLAMAPLSRRARLREVMNACGMALRGWLRAQLVSMTLVGVLVGLGLWIIGVPAPVALGMITGIAQFVPIVGPIASAAPALILGAMQGGQTFWLTLALYGAVSQLEANVITPMVQKNLASLPVVLGIFGIVALGILFGPLGVLFATPLCLVAYTTVTLLYRQDVLHDKDALAPGQSSP